MNILIVYDSVFGNTKQIATSMYDGLKKLYQVQIKSADAVTIDDVDTADLLFIGSPTRAFSATTKIKRFIRSLGHKHKKLMTAVFDTRMASNDSKNKLGSTILNVGGYANYKMARMLLHKKIDCISPEEAFYVKDLEGPLKKNETERSSEWALKIASDLEAV